MTNPSMNTGQTYYWTQEHMKYYPVPPVPNFPPPNYNQPPNYNFSYNVPPPNVSDVKSPNSMYQFAPPTYHDGATNFYNNVPYQNQTDPQYNNQYYDKTETAQQFVNENYTNWDRRDTYDNSADNEWRSNNSTTNWTMYQNISTSSYDMSKIYNDNERTCSAQRYELLHRIKEPEWKYDNRETLSNRTSSKQRSRSPEGRSEKVCRSRYDDRRDKYRQYNKDISNLREPTYDSGYFERRSSYKKHESYTSRSEGSYTRSRSRKRSKSRESRSTRDTTPISTKRTKGPTERELLLEKYR